MPPTLTLLASGTRGDVLPYLALGQGLQRASYRVVIATHAEFQPLVARAQLNFALLEGNPSTLMLRADGQSALAFDGHWLRSVRATWAYWRAAQPVYARLLASAWDACRGADAVLIGLPTVWGIHIAEALGVPCIGAFLQPVTPTDAFPSAVLPTTFSLGPLYNRLTHHLLSQAVWQPWRGLINQWRCATLGLRPAPVFGPRWHDLYTVYGFSPRLRQRPRDWALNHIITGYWFWDDDRQWRPDIELETFLEAGPTIAIGLGSPGTRRPDAMVALIVRAALLAEVRVVLALPHGLTHPPTLPPTIQSIGAIPHHWLFPRVAAVVHHGGAGTTGNGLRAGLPTLILPQAVDQFFWGARVDALGVGPRPLPQRSLTAADLARALRQLIDADSLRTNAHRLGKQLRGEDGVGRAVEVVRALV